MRAQKCIPLVGVKTTLTCTALQTTVSNVRAENGNLRKFGSTFRHGTVFATKKIFISKGSYVYRERAENCIPLVGPKTVLTCKFLQTTTFLVEEYRAAN